MLQLKVTSKGIKILSFTKSIKESEDNIPYSQKET